MTSTQILDEHIHDVKKLLIEVSGIQDLTLETIDENSPLFDGGLGLDSIDVLELVVRLDKRYGLKIRNDENGKKVLQNVRCIAEAIASQRVPG